MISPLQTFGIFSSKKLFCVTRLLFHKYLLDETRKHPCGVFATPLNLNWFWLSLCLSQRPKAIKPVIRIILTVKWNRQFLEIAFCISKNLCFFFSETTVKICSIFVLLLLFLASIVPSIGITNWNSNC